VSELVHDFPAQQKQPMFFLCPSSTKKTEPRTETPQGEETHKIFSKKNLKIEE